MRVRIVVEDDEGNKLGENVTLLQANMLVEIPTYLLYPISGDLIQVTSHAYWETKD